MEAGGASYRTECLPSVCLCLRLELVRLRIDFARLSLACAHRATPLASESYHALKCGPVGRSVGESDTGPVEYAAAQRDSRELNLLLINLDQHEVGRHLKDLAALHRAPLGVERR